MSDLIERDRISGEVWNGTCPGCLGSGDETGRPGFRRCLACGTIWVPSRRHYKYDDDSPTFRAHHDDAIAICKIRTFDHWCRHLTATLAGQNVLEVGFGGGASLAHMQALGATVSGVEPVQANREAAVRTGIPSENIKAKLADFRGGRFDLVIYQDSFEHEIEPSAHLATLNRLTGAGARALLVLPVADCASRRLMGSWWPHDIKDHWVFYSTNGLARLWETHGWRLASTFRPSKYVSGLTIARHVQHKTRIPLPATSLRSTAIWLNFGERGLIFEKC
jgi:SAM-dependent methyltransferase